MGSFAEAVGNLFVTVFAFLKPYWQKWTDGSDEDAVIFTPGIPVVLAAIAGIRPFNPDQFGSHYFVLEPWVVTTTNVTCALTLLLGPLFCLATGSKRESIIKRIDDGVGSIGTLICMAWYCFVRAHIAIITVNMVLNWVLAISSAHSVSWALTAYGIVLLAFWFKTEGEKLWDWVMIFIDAVIPMPKF